MCVLDPRLSTPSNRRPIACLKKTDLLWSCIKIYTPLPILIPNVYKNLHTPLEVYKKRQ